VVQHLPSKCDTLSSTPVLPKENIYTKRERERGREEIYLLISWEAVSSMPVFNIYPLHLPCWATMYMRRKDEGRVSTLLSVMHEHNFYS
jgi:hypothetical protein